MVILNFQQSSAQRSVTLEEPVVEVNTLIHIGSTSGLKLGEAFPFSGQLVREDTLFGLSGETVTISVDGNVVGTPTTYKAGVTDGLFDQWITIDEPGTHIIRVDFAGSTRAGVTYRSSSSARSIGFGDTNKIALALGLVVLGYILFG